MYAMQRNLRRLAVVGLMLMSVGCMTERIVHDGWASFPRDPKPTSTDADGSDGRRSGAAQAWTVPVESFTGMGRHQRASRLGSRVNSLVGMNGAWVSDNGLQTTLFFGRFSSAQSPEAQLALHAIREIEVDDERPYAEVRLVPMSPVVRTASDSRDLSQYSGMYSLQIAAFRDQDAAAQRDAAEEYADQLRKDGDEAYYFHGRTMSLVTVGLFAKDQALVTVDNPLAPGSKVDRYGPAVLELQKKHPFNLINGMTVVEKQNGKVMGEQPSMLVPVP